MAANESARESGAPVAAFDQLAADYDADFSRTELGKRLRSAVWDRLDRWVEPGHRVLDLGCGTGEDALHLAELGAQVEAMDGSMQMVSTARRKTAEVESQVSVHHAGIQELDDLESVRGQFDGALSNFGALNCVQDLPQALSAVSDRLRPGGYFLACVMGPIVPWEWLWMLLTAEPKKAFRRLKRGGVEWRGMRIHYPSIRRFRRSCPTQLQPQKVSAVGAFLPPTYVEPWIRRHPRFLNFLDSVEGRFRTWPPFPSVADHYLVELRRI